MAEAFGLAAGVLQAAGFGAAVGSTLWRCARKFHNASKELEEIARQVESTALSLAKIDTLLRDPTTRALHTLKLYEDTSTVSDGFRDVFRELKDLVESYESKSGFRGMTVRSRIGFLFDIRKLQELGRVLRHYSDVLHLMVSVMAIVEGRRAAFVHHKMKFLQLSLMQFTVPKTKYRRWRPTSSTLPYQTRIFLIPTKP